MKIARYALLMSALGVTALLVGCGGEAETEVTGERPAVPVRVNVVEPIDENVVKTYTGSLEGRNQAVLYAKIAEAVDTVLVREGDRVRRNGVLVELDKDGPTSNYQQALSRFRNAEKTFRKMKYLYDEGAVSETEFDAAETEYEVARATFESARKLVEIQSPINGTVTAVNVRKGDFLAQGQQVATVAQTDTLRVKFDVKTNDIQLIDEGDTVLVRRENARTTTRGVVSAVAQSADPFTRSFEVEALIGDTAGTYRPGMFVRVDIIVERLADILAVPRDAIIQLSDRTALFVVNEGLAFRRDVTLGADLQGRVVVESGIQPGDTVVTLGQSYLDDSLKVRVTEVEKGA